MPAVGMAQSEMNYELLNYMASREKDPDPKNKDQIKKQFQSYFVKEVFLNQVFTPDQLFYGDDAGVEYGLVNQLMINQFADLLVDRQFLDLSHISIDD